MLPTTARSSATPISLMMRSSRSLESDVPFRAVATLLVQRYGYLVPKVNPDSEAGKERELLIQDRTKWLAQRQEEELSQARQVQTRNQQNNGACDVQDAQFDNECNARKQARPSSVGGSGQGLRRCSPPPERFPESHSLPICPTPGGNSLMRAQAHTERGRFLRRNFPASFHGFLRPIPIFQ